MLFPSGKTADTSQVFPDSEGYRTELEEQTRKLIKELEGVSDCKVMITLESGYEYLYASDQTLDRAYDNSGTLLSSNAGKEYVLNGDGYPIIISEALPTVSGIAVVAKNISAETEYKIVRLLQAVYGISAHRISVET